MRRILAIGLLTMFVIACSSSDDDPRPNNNEDNEALVAAENYFNSNLKSIIQNKCISCHTNYHSSGAKNYSVFTNAKNSASTIFNQVNNGSMPKGGEKLPQSEIDNFKEFLDLVNEIN